MFTVRREGRGVLWAVATDGSHDVTFGGVLSMRLCLLRRRLSFRSGTVLAAPTTIICGVPVLLPIM